MLKQEYHEHRSKNKQINKTPHHKHKSKNQTSQPQNTKAKMWLKTALHMTYHAVSWMHAVTVAIWPCRTWIRSWAKLTTVAPWIRWAMIYKSTRQKDMSQPLKKRNRRITFNKACTCTKPVIKLKASYRWQDYYNIINGKNQFGKLWNLVCCSTMLRISKSSQWQLMNWIASTIKLIKLMLSEMFVITYSTLLQFKNVR